MGNKNFLQASTLYRLTKVCSWVASLLTCTYFQTSTATEGRKPKGAHCCWRLQQAGWLLTLATIRTESKKRLLIRIIYVEWRNNIPRDDDIDTIFSANHDKLTWCWSCSDWGGQWESSLAKVKAAYRLAMTIQIRWFATVVFKVCLGARILRTAYQQYLLNLLTSILKSSRRWNDLFSFGRRMLATENLARCSYTIRVTSSHRFPFLSDRQTASFY